MYLLALLMNYMIFAIVFVGVVAVFFTVFKELFDKPYQNIKRIIKKMFKFKWKLFYGVRIWKELSAN